MKIFQIFYIGVLILLFCGNLSLAKSTTGTVNKVIDGDSIIVEIGKNKVREVRLYGIDSPEYDQPYAKSSKRYLNKTLLNESVELTVFYSDRYGRDVCLVEKGDKVINEELVRLGYAWVYPKYCKKKICSKWEAYQRKAKKNKIGLWKGKKTISPWAWKHK